MTVSHSGSQIRGALEVERGGDRAGKTGKDKGRSTGKRRKG